MKLLTIVLGAAVFSHFTFAAGFSPGTWRLADARCTETSYVMTPDERAFVDAIRSGLTIDHYRFADATHGEYVTQFVQPKARCIGRASVAVEYPGDGTTKLKFGPMKWESKSDDPLVHLDCSGDDKAHEDLLRYSVTGDELAFVHRSDAQCGDFRMIWRREARRASGSTVPTVRVQSGPCGTTENVKRGAGFAFGFEGRTYVVAAQSRVYHGNEKFCHFVDGKPAKLAAVEWGNGLALLEVPNEKPAAAWPAFARDVSASQPVSVDPAGGKLVAVKSPRQYHPLVDTAYEVDKLPLHAGDVGAPVLSESGEIVGVVSQYYLKLAPGHPTRVAEWDPADAKAQTRSVVLPGRVIDAWLAPLREHRAFARRFVVSPEDQLKGLRRVSAGALAFEEIAAPPSTAPTPDGDFPIGGGDGVGVGGGADLESHAKLRVRALASPVSDYDFNGRAPWAASAAALGELEVPFVFRDYRTFGSAAEFFAVLQRAPKAEIATIRKSVAAGYANLRERSLAAARECFLYYRRPTFTDERVLDLVRHVYLAAKLLDSESRETVTPAELAELSDAKGRYSREWALLLNPVAHHQAMHQALVALAEEWTKLRP